MARLHIGMTAKLSDEELETQFAANVRFLEQLAGQLASVVIEIFEHEAQNEAKQRQVQIWRNDQFLTELIAIYQEESREHPINGRWITLGRQKEYQYQESAE